MRGTGITIPLTVVRYYIKKNYLGALYLATTDFDLSRSTSKSTCLCDHLVITSVKTP